MAKTITVKGIGKVTARPDYVVLSMTLESKNIEYDKAMDTAGSHIQNLNETLFGIGFERGSVKTTNFNVHTDYDRVKDPDGNYQNVFCGYVVTHNLKLAFDFDMDRLSHALSAIAGCLSHPQLSVTFTVKDASAIKEELLHATAANAKRQAEILCDASGVTLGDLIAIDYNFDELDIRSHTRYECCDNAMPLMAKSIDIDPDDINISDTATFVWEIK